MPNINLRLPPKLHAEMTKLAKRNRRSLNSEILIALEQYVKAQQANPSKPQDVHPKEETR